MFGVLVSFCLILDNAAEYSETQFQLLFEMLTWLHFESNKYQGNWLSTEDLYYLHMKSYEYINV